MEKKLYHAAEDDKVKDVKEILRTNPNLDVNWKSEEGRTALIIACEIDHDSIVSILLTHPDIDVNLKDKHGWTSFNSAWINGCASVVRLLLKDSRVMVNEPTSRGNTPLFWAAFYGKLDVIMWWIASGREMDLGTPGNDETDAIMVAKERGMTEVVALLERFMENPVETRH